MLSFDEACALSFRYGSRLIAIDGLPGSGKSTLAKAIVESTGFQCIGVDDFFLHYEEFLAAIRQLAESGRCSYCPFDWENMKVGKEARLVTLADGPVLVEGTSSLHPDIAPLFDLRFFVESDETTILEAVLERDGNFFEKEWRESWLANAAAYMQTKPQERADFVVAGRGAHSKAARCLN